MRLRAAKIMSTNFLDFLLGFLTVSISLVLILSTTCTRCADLKSATRMRLEDALPLWHFFTNVHAQEDVF